MRDSRNSCSIHLHRLVSYIFQTLEAKNYNGPDPPQIMRIDRSQMQRKLVTLGTEHDLVQLGIKECTQFTHHDKLTEIIEEYARHREF